ncbi:uncharacterized protein [Dendrobates tinctorius]|uniref:uncharacterized protein n=1 Tax=Dendrobates tinctorius TaxID=92724 RepID=UPI003CC947D5
MCVVTKSCVFVNIVVNDVTRCWRSCRDTYRRERQLRSRNGAAGTTKRKYLYYDRLHFLAPVMELRPTESNLTERETGSDSEVLNDPESDVAAGSGPSAGLPRATPPPPPRSPPPESVCQPAQPEDRGNSSSPTMPLETSPQPSALPRRGRCRREGAASGTRMQVDRGVLNFLSTAAHDDGEEAYGRSLAQYLRAIPRGYRLRTRGALQIVLDGSTPPNNPRSVFQFLERWQLSDENQIDRLVGLDVTIQPSLEPVPPPPPRVTTPPPQPAHIPNVAPQVQYMGQGAHAQYGHFNLPNVGGWPQHGYVGHGHIGGYGQFGQPYQDYPQQYPNYPYQNQQNDPGRMQQMPQPAASAQGDRDVGQQPRPNVQRGPPPSPPPTYHDL